MLSIEDTPPVKDRSPLGVLSPFLGVEHGVEATGEQDSKVGAVSLDLVLARVDILAEVLVLLACILSKLSSLTTDVVVEVLLVNEHSHDQVIVIAVLGSPE